MEIKLGKLHFHHQTRPPGFHGLNSNHSEMEHFLEMFFIILMYCYNLKECKINFKNRTHIPEDNFPFFV